MSDRDAGENGKLLSGANQHTEPLKQNQVQEEAQKLEQIAGNFFSHNDEAGALQKWHEEMIEIAKHGLSSVKDVFHQVETDNSGINPLLPKAVLREDANEETLLLVPSFTVSFLTADNRDLGSSVDHLSVYSAARGQDPHSDTKEFTPMHVR